MIKEEHDELCWYLEQYLIQCTEKIKSHDRFMRQSYWKLVNSTLSDLLVIDAEEAGL